jgi:hypothetical protein
MPETALFRCSDSGFFRIFTRWLPAPGVLHPYPIVRFLTTHPRWELHVCRSAPTDLCGVLSDARPYRVQCGHSATYHLILGTSRIGCGFP